MVQGSKVVSGATGKTHHQIVSTRLSLEVQEVLFTGGFTINKDTDGDFDDKWIKDRDQDKQSPVCYARDTQVKVTATFNVVKAPTSTVMVKIEATATFGARTMKWKSDALPVNHGMNTLAVPLMTSDTKLPNWVNYYQASIAWKYTVTTAPNAPNDIGTTQNDLYATLATPIDTKAVYWTLVDLSCKAAKKAANEDDFVDRVFAPFQSHTGDGNGIVRLRDGVHLTYYLNGRDTPPGNVEPRVWSTWGILNLPSGTGRCGGWKDVLMHTHGIHGVTSAREVCIYSKPETMFSCSVVFLVKNCDFTANIGLGPFPFHGTVDCVKRDGLAGQGKTNPHFVFGDHVLTVHGKTFYDPSYGVKMAASKTGYETAAISGLGLWGPISQPVGFDQSGTLQLITKLCSRGFTLEQFDPVSNTLTNMKDKYGVASEQAIVNHSYNAVMTWRTTAPNQPNKGDWVYIPREIADTDKFVMLKWVGYP